MKFSEQIKDLRTREKLTQEQFAEKLNIQDRRYRTGKIIEIFQTSRC